MRLPLKLFQLGNIKSAYLARGKTILIFVTTQPRRHCACIQRLLAVIIPSLMALLVLWLLHQQDPPHLTQPSCVKRLKKKKKAPPSAGDAKAQRQESSVVLSKIARIDLAVALFLNVHLITTLLLG